MADRGTLRNRFRAFMCVAVVGTLALCGAALGMPPALTDPADNDLVTSLRPAFSWRHNGVVNGGATTSYDVFVDGVGVVATLPRSGPSTNMFTTPAAVDLPDDSSLMWSVIARGPEGAEQSSKQTLRTSTPPTTPPTILGGPAGPTNQTTPTFNWGGTRATSAWALLGADGAAIQTGEVGSGSGSAQLATLGDGAYTFRVLQRSSQAQESPAATRAFTVDTQSPAILLITAVPSFPTLNASPTFAWAGVEPGAKVAWQVIGVGGNTVRGPVVTTAGSARVGPLPQGSFLFQVRQTDAAGNSSEWRSEPFAVAPGATVTGGPRLPSHNAKALTPRSAPGSPRDARCCAGRPPRRRASTTSRSSAWPPRAGSRRSARCSRAAIASASPRGASCRGAPATCGGSGPTWAGPSRRSPSGSAISA